MKNFRQVDDHAEEQLHARAGENTMSIGTMTIRLASEI
jgi:hypothetical protein